MPYRLFLHLNPKFRVKRSTSVKYKLKLKCFIPAQILTSSLSHHDTWACQFACHFQIVFCPSPRHSGIHGSSAFGWTYVQTSPPSSLFLNCRMWPLDLKKIFLRAHRSRKTFHPFSRNVDSQLDALWTQSTVLYSNWHIIRPICAKWFVWLSSRRWIGINMDVSHLKSV